MSSNPPIVTVITEATNVGLISLADAKIMLDIPESDTSQDVKMQMLIDQISMTLALEANRDTFAYEQVTERWLCEGPVCCPDGTCNVYLTRYPVEAADITLIESPAGTPIDPASFLLEENTGRLVLLGGCASEIYVEYSGGYHLPDDAPLPLRQAIQLRLRQFKSQEAQEATGGSGIRMIAHKDSRVMYFAPKDMVAGGGSTSGGVSVSAADSAVKNLISKYTRLWI
jgi:hypothetical protein